MADGQEAGRPERRRARRRCTRHLADALGDGGGASTFLERKSVEPATLATYQKAWRRFEDFARQRGLRLNSDETVDDALVQYFTTEYFRGSHPGRGEETLVGLLMLTLAFSKLGSRRVPGPGEPSEGGGG